MKKIMGILLLILLSGNVLFAEQKVFRGKEYNQMEFINFLGGSDTKKIMVLPDIKTKAKFSTSIVQYIATLNAVYMYCDARINDISAFSNEGSRIGLLKDSFDFLESVELGSNEISIEVADLFFINPKEYFPQKFKDENLENKYRDWRDEMLEELDLLTDEERADHLERGYCSLLIEAQTLDGESEREPIAYLKIMRGADETFQISEESFGFLAETEVSLKDTIKSEIITRDEGWIGDVFKLSQEIQLTDIPHWAWIDAPKFEDIPDNVERLQQGYQNFWNILHSHDEEAIKEYLALSLDELSMAKGYANRGDEKVQELWEYFYDRLGYGSLIEEGYTMEPLDFTNFEVKQSADGKLVRFVEKGFKIKPPISYKRTGSKDKSYLHHYFAFIDGEFILVR